MSFPASGLYVGTVRHRRRLTLDNTFEYPIFHAFLDLDRLEELTAVSPLLSRNRFNWASLHDADFLPDRPEPTLRLRLAAAALEAGHTLPEGKVFLLGNLRYLGYCFNPAAYYFAYDAQGRLALICAEVSNTPWKERHRYWMDPAQGVQPAGGWAFVMPKVFHVSPFMPMDLSYHWSFTSPEEQLAIHLALFQQEAPVFDATLKLAWRPWTAGEVRRTLLRFPAATLKVIAAIYWQALRLWLRRAPFYNHPNS